MMKQEGYYCHECKTFHEELPFSYVTEAPIYFYNMDEEERKKRFYLKDNVYMLDKEHFFVNGIIPIYVKELDVDFYWGVWVSLSKESYYKVKKRRRLGFIEPMFGWLSTEIPIYPDTVNLKTKVHYQAGEELPIIELEPTDHPLALEYEHGISLARVEEIAHLLCKIQQEDDEENE
ncbi:DUF2199 domain-containing protein [Bacillus sp. C1-1]|nr:DUF2199 domain-containing protein [Bacillus sp. C1-1]